MVCVILSIEDDGIAQSVRRGNREERGGTTQKHSGHIRNSVAGVSHSRTNVLDWQTECSGALKERWRAGPDLIFFYLSRPVRPHVLSSSGSV